MTERRFNPVVTEKTQSSSYELSPNMLLNVREFAEMTVYATTFGALFGGLKGFLQLRKANISKMTLERVRTNLFYRKQQEKLHNEKMNQNPTPTPPEFNPYKNESETQSSTSQPPQYDPKTTQVGRKHIILAHMFHQGFRYAINAGLFACAFSLGDLFLRNRNTFNNLSSKVMTRQESMDHSTPNQMVNTSDDDNDEKHQSIHSLSHKISQLTLTDEQLQTIENNALLKERINQLNLLHKPIAGACAGTLFGLLASIPNLFMGAALSSVLSIGASSCMYGLLFGTVSAVFILPLQSFYMVERFHEYQRHEKQFKEQTKVEELVGAELDTTKERMGSFIKEEQLFLTELERINQIIQEKEASQQTKQETGGVEEESK